MGEDVEGGICGENNNWWSSIDSTRSASVFIPPLITSSSSSSSPNCSVVAATNDAGNCTTWQSTGDDFMDLKSRSCGGFPDEQKPHKNDNNNNESADGESGSILMDSTLQIMGYGLSSSTSLPNWDHHHSLLRAENNLNNNSMVVEEERGIDCSKEWITSKSFSASSSSPLFSNRSMMSSSMRRGFPIGSSSYVSPSTLIHSLYADPDPQSQSQSQAHHSLFTNLSTMSYSSSPSFLKPSPMAKQQQQQQTPVGLHFSNNTPFWNASADALNDIRAGAFASSSPSPSSILFNKLIKSEESDTESAKKNVGEAAFKRPRIETPSPLPTFKVRKEKLGDRVTALQQLVSPFGKTDTASVLHEAIEYIKFLHDQVSVLSTPYMKSGGPIHDQRQQGCDDRKESLSSSKEDLRSRGLCLVPISSTFPVATETTADFWTPSLSFAAAGASLLR